MADCELDLDGILAARKAAVAAALNLCENRRPDLEGAVAERLACLARHARPDRQIVGVTGPPGAGKSTLIARLVRGYRAAGHRVGVLAVDPSSRRSGGALLGDRARIDHDPGDPGVFIRSMAAGSHLGGLAWRTRHCLTVFEAAYDRILVETTGVGQSETEIDTVADTVVFVVQPGSGDSLQFIKAGIMEIPHVLVVNKADMRSAALKAFHELEGTLRAQDGWMPPVILVSAREGWGHHELLQKLDEHRSSLGSAGLGRRRRESRIRWAYLFFREAFGSYGVERLGGEQRVLERLAEAEADPCGMLPQLAREAADAWGDPRPA
jgi:LAO/AO transport system kinase